MIRGMPWGRQLAVRSPVGLPSRAFSTLVSKIFWYSGVSGACWPTPGATPGVQPMPPWFSQMPVKSRGVLGL